MQKVAAWCLVKIDKCKIVYKGISVLILTTDFRPSGNNYICAIYWSLKKLQYVLWHVGVQKKDSNGFLMPFAKEISAIE